MIGKIKKAYIIMALVSSVFLALLLIRAVSFLPKYGDPAAPANNEVAERYLEKGLEETGAVNAVAGMILDYRAFDTFGESCVLFVVMCIVVMMLFLNRDEDPEEYGMEDLNDRYYDADPDTILTRMSRIIFPLIMVLGMYIVLNGHISPGGGFSGGAVLGAGLILFLTSFGYEMTERFLTERLISRLTCGALIFYCLAKSYSFYTGANHLDSFITPGTPGAILSAGLIVYLNACVGIVVACTMYSFYTLFRRGRY